MIYRGAIEGYAPGTYFWGVTIGELVRTPWPDPPDTIR
jgi:hypothetical protein